MELVNTCILVVDFLFAFYDEVAFSVSRIGSVLRKVMSLYKEQYF
jgi:hypothetical protein